MISPADKKEGYHGLSIGQRIHVTGNSCSGKSTLGEKIAAVINVPFIEIDALNWEPGWVGLNEVDPDELMRRMRKATAGDGWVVAGSYTKFAQQTFWPRLETIIWLDLPIHLLLSRWLIRSWQRWRTSELLWETNVERFWPQLMIWRKKESLLYWILTQHQRKRRLMHGYSKESRWQHIRFVRIRSSAEVEAFSDALRREGRYH